MAESVIQRSFAQGELTPAIHVRADLPQYLQGLRTCRNFIVRREGGVSYRPGFKYVATIKDGSSDDVILYRFETEVAGEAYLIEAGLSYLRFHKDGAPVLVSSVPAYSGATAYVPGDLVASGGVNYYCIAATTGNAPPNATYWYALTGSIFEVPAPAGFNLICEDSQNGNVLTLTRQDQQPLELIYSGATSWVLQTVATAPGIDAPLNVAVAGGVAGTRTSSYIVTAVNADDYEESNPSVAGTAGSVDTPTEDNPNVVTWDAVAGAAEYYVYHDPYENGVHGFVGVATSNSFNDTGFVPDFAVTPPVARVLFATSGNYPNVSAVVKQRRFFASTANEPERIDASRVGFFSNFSITSPLQDDDALTFRLSGVHYHVIRWIRSLQQLIVGTDGGVWSVGQPKTPLTPSTLDADQQTYAGVHDKPPIVIGNTLIYLEARGVRVRDLQFDDTVQGFAGRDLTTFAAHLFDGYSLSRMDFQNVPHSTVWAVRGDGTLLGLTYVPGEEVYGWHRHDSTVGNGVFEHVKVIPEDVEDALYVVIKRTINGAETRYIERMEPMSVLDLDTDAFYVDSGVRYSGVATTAITGLDHLEGETVYALADGVVRGPFTVASGAITLPLAASEVVVGATYVGDFETLDLDVQGSAVRDRKKRIAGVTLMLENSSRVFEAGPDVANLRAFDLQAHEDQSTLFTGQAQLNPTSHFNLEGRVFVRHDDPLPLTITGIIPSVEMGG